MLWKCRVGHVVDVTEHRRNLVDFLVRQIT